MAEDLSAEEIAKLFHASYERLAPDFGYETRRASAKSWSDVPAQNRALMTATCAEVLAALDLPARDARVRAQAAKELAFVREMLTGIPDILDETNPTSVRAARIAARCARANLDAFLSYEPVSPSAKPATEEPRCSECDGPLVQCEHCKRWARCGLATCSKHAEDGPQSFEDLQRAQGVTGLVDPAALAVPDLTDEEREAFIAEADGP